MASTMATELLPASETISTVLHTERQQTQLNNVDGKDPRCEEQECRICLQGSEDELLIQPCSCTGSLRQAHLSCLMKWAVEKRSTCCELCKDQYKEPYFTAISEKLAQVEEEEQRDRPYALYLATADFNTTANDRQTEPESVPTTAWQNVLCHVVILLVLMGVILYLTVFSNIAPAASDDWTSVLWRVLTILIPGYLVGRMLFLIFVRWRNERALRRHMMERQRENEQRLLALRAAEAEALALEQLERLQQAQRQEQEEEERVRRAASQHSPSTSDAARENHEARGGDGTNINGAETLSSSTSQQQQQDVSHVHINVDMASSADGRSNQNAAPSEHARSTLGENVSMSHNPALRSAENADIGAGSVVVNISQNTRL